MSNHRAWAVNITSILPTHCRQTDSSDPGSGLNSGQAAVWQKKGQKGYMALKETLTWLLASALWCGREVGEEKKWCPWIHLAQACIMCGKMAAWMSWAPEHQTTHSCSSAEKPLCHVLPNDALSHWETLLRGPSRCCTSGEQGHL